LTEKGGERCDPNQLLKEETTRRGSGNKGVVGANIGPATKKWEDDGKKGGGLLGV